jgi:hypothetical protein
LLLAASVARRDFRPAPALPPVRLTCIGFQTPCPRGVGMPAAFRSVSNVANHSPGLCHGRRWGWRRRRGRRWWCGGGCWWSRCRSRCWWSRCWRHRSFLFRCIFSVALILRQPLGDDENDPQGQEGSSATSVLISRSLCSLAPAPRRPFHSCRQPRKAQNGLIPLGDRRLPGNCESSAERRRPPAGVSRVRAAVTWQEYQCPNFQFQAIASAASSISATISSGSNAIGTHARF